MFTWSNPCLVHFKVTVTHCIRHVPGDLRNEKLPAGMSVMSVTRWRTCINNYCIVYETDRWGKDDSLSGRSSGQWPADNKLAYSQIQYY